MLPHAWPDMQNSARSVAGWMDARLPAAVPRWIWAACTVLVALVIGRIGGRVLAGLVQLALLAAALLVAWQMVQAPALTGAALPRACALEGTCARTPATTSAGTAVKNKTTINL